MKGFPKTVEGRALYALEFYKQNLETHFLTEEKVLLPAIKGFDHDLDKLAEEIKGEHVRLRQLFHALHDPKELEEKLDILGYALETHIRKEERLFFEKIQEVLPNVILVNLKEKLEVNYT